MTGKLRNAHGTAVKVADAYRIGVRAHTGSPLLGTYRMKDFGFKNQEGSRYGLGRNGGGDSPVR